MKRNATILRFAIRLNAQAVQAGGHVLPAVRSIAGFFFATQTHLRCAFSQSAAVTLIHSVLLFLNLRPCRMETAKYPHRSRSNRSGRGLSIGNVRHFLPNKLS
jgi:hypothetical protein